MERYVIWAKKCSSEFQKIMNDIFNPFQDFSIVYIDDVLIFSHINQDFKHLQTFFTTVKRNGLVVSKSKKKSVFLDLKFIWV